MQEKDTPRWKIQLFGQPGSFSEDMLTDILRKGACQLLAQAIEAEVAAHLAEHTSLTDDKGRKRIVRAICQSGRFRPALDLCQLGFLAYATEIPTGRVAHPFHLVDSAALFAPSQVGGGTAALALSERDFHGRLL